MLPTFRKHGIGWRLKWRLRCTTRLRTIGATPGSWRTKHDRIPPGLAAALYSEAQALAARDPSPVSIARQLSASHALSLSPGTVRHWIVGDRKLQRRNVLDDRPSPDLSFVIGANIGDGCALTNGWSVKLEVTDLDFAEAFNASMAKVFSHPVTNKILVRNQPGRLPLYVVKYSSKQLVELLRLPQSKLLEIAFAFPREFLRGFFDAEGHVDVGINRYLQLSIGAENTDKSLLQRVRKLLKEMGINSRIDRKRTAGSVQVIRGREFKKRRTSYSLIIGKRDDIERIVERVGFSIQRKVGKVNDALSLNANVSPAERPQAWKQLYLKKRGEWVKRDLTVT